MTYYTRGYSPQPTQRVGSAELKAEFQAIEDGLNAAEAQDGKAVRAPEAISGLPNAISRANKVLSFDGSGNPAVPIAVVDLANAVNAANNAADSATAAAESADLAAEKVSLAAEQVSLAAIQAGIAATKAEEAAASAESIEGGPVASVNGATGAVTIPLNHFVLMSIGVF